MALIPQLVERERLPNAIALGSIPWQAGRMIGPVHHRHPHRGLRRGGRVRDGGRRLLHRARSCTAACRLSGDAPAHDGRHVLRQFAEGLGFVGHNFVFASLIALALFNSLFAMSYLTLLPVFADSYFGAGSAGYGLLNAAHGAGALFGTLHRGHDRPSASCARARRC